MKIFQKPSIQKLIYMNIKINEPGLIGPVFFSSSPLLLLAETYAI